MGEVVTDGAGSSFGIQQLSPKLSAHHLHAIYYYYDCGTALADANSGG
jgi:hypothetical protein